MSSHRVAAAPRGMIQSSLGGSADWSRKASAVTPAASCGHSPPSRPHSKGKLAPLWECPGGHRPWTLRGRGGVAGARLGLLSGPRPPVPWQGHRWSFLPPQPRSLQAVPLPGGSRQGVDLTIERPEGCADPAPSPAMHTPAAQPRCPPLPLLRALGVQVWQFCHSAPESSLGDRVCCGQPHFTQPVLFLKATPAVLLPADPEAGSSAGGRSKGHVLAFRKVPAWPGSDRGPRPRGSGGAILPFSFALF